MRILSLAPLAGPGLAALERLGSVEVDPWIDHVPIKLHSADELVARSEGVDILIVEADHLSAEVMARAPSLRAIGVCRGDPNNVDVAAATAAGIPVIRTPGRNAEAVADLTLALMLCLLRGVVAADRDIRAGRWVVDGRIAQQRYVGRGLASCAVGLVGAGAVGLAVARRVAALGARVIASDPAASPDGAAEAGIADLVALDELMSSCEIVSIHAPLVQGTRDLIGAAELSSMRPGSFLVNTARFGIVAEEPLVEALRNGPLGGAALDHFTNEFLAPDHPLVSMDNVVLTPHIGGSTVGTVETHTAQIADALAALIGGGSSRLVVNDEVGFRR